MAQLCGTRKSFTFSGAPFLHLYEEKMLRITSKEVYDDQMR